MLTKEDEVGEKRVGFGIFGAAHHHSLSFAAAVLRHPRAKLLGVYDQDERTGRAFAKKFGIPLFDDEGALLACEGLDAGIVTSENALKKDLSITLAKSRKHVLCDKPLGIDRTQSREIIQACRASRVKLSVGYLSRYAPEAMEAKRKIEAGRVGDVKLIIGENRVDAGSVMLLSPWLAESRATGGRGALLEHAVHVADLAQWYTSSTPKKVYAATTKKLDERFEVEDNFCLLVEYESGACATLDGSYCRPTSGRVDDLTMRILGERGEIRLFIQKKALMLKLGEEAGVTHGLIESDLGDRYRGVAAWNMIDDFINCIRGGDEPLTSGDEAAKVNALVEAGYKSLESRTEVRVIN